VYHLIAKEYILTEKVIGQGHFGEVYKGRLVLPEMNINKTVAIKALKGKCM